MLIWCFAFNFFVLKKHEKYGDASVSFGSCRNMRPESRILESCSCSFPRCFKTATHVVEFESFAGQQSFKMHLVLSVWSEASPVRTTCSWCSSLQSEELTIATKQQPLVDRTLGHAMWVWAIGSKCMCER